MTNSALKQRAILMMVKMGVVDAGAGAGIPQEIVIQSIDLPMRTTGEINTEALKTYVAEGAKTNVNSWVSGGADVLFPTVQPRGPTLANLPRANTTHINLDQLADMLRFVGNQADLNTLSSLENKKPHELINVYNEIITRRPELGAARIRLSQQEMDRINGLMQRVQSQAAAQSKAAPEPIRGAFDPDKTDPIIAKVMKELESLPNKDNPQAVRDHFAGRVKALQNDIQNELKNNPKQVPYNKLAEIVLYQQLATFKDNKVPNKNSLQAALDTNDDKYISANEWRIAYNNVRRSLGLPELTHPDLWTWFTEFFGDLPTIQKVALVVGVPLSLIGLVGTLISGPDIMSLLVFGLGLAGIIWPLYTSGTLSQVIDYLAGGGQQTQAG